jgi:hypothetical protein
MQYVVVLRTDCEDNYVGPFRSERKAQKECDRLNKAIQRGTKMAGGGYNEYSAHVSFLDKTGYLKSSDLAHTVSERTESWDDGD